MRQPSTPVRLPALLRRPPSTPPLRRKPPTLRAMPMSATGRLHGFESLAERRVLLALDFVGGMTGCCRSRSP